MKNKMADLERSMTSAGYDPKRSFVLNDVGDITSAAAPPPGLAQQQLTDAQSGDPNKGKKKKKKAEIENGPKLMEKKDLIISLLERLTRGEQTE